jgi:hypothetical protein
MAPHKASVLIRRTGIAYTPQSSVYQTADRDTSNTCFTKYGTGNETKVSPVLLHSELKNTYALLLNFRYFDSSSISLLLSRKTVLV